MCQTFAILLVLNRWCLATWMVWREGKGREGEGKTFFPSGPLDIYKPHSRAVQSYQLKIIPVYLFRPECHLSVFPPMTGSINTHVDEREREWHVPQWSTNNDKRRHDDDYSFSEADKILPRISKIGIVYHQAVYQSSSCSLRQCRRARLLPQGGGRSQSTLGLHDLDTRACTLSLPGQNNVYARCYHLGPTKSIFHSILWRTCLLLCLKSNAVWLHFVSVVISHPDCLADKIISVHKDKTFIFLISIVEKKNTHNYTLHT